MKKNYLNTKICKQCGGACCKRLPGGCLPEDFGEPLFENLIKAFKTGYAIDWWEGDPTGKDKVACGYFVRPKIKGVDRLYDPSWGGECIFFIEGKGCTLLPDKRPAECRMLEPKKDGNCIKHEVEKRTVAIAWLPFHKIIHKAAEQVDVKSPFKNSSNVTEFIEKLEERMGKAWR